MGKQSEPIAIVGSACRFPGGANSPSALWKLLHSPRDVCQDIPHDRFDTSSFYHPDGSHHGTSNVLRSYFLDDDIRAFDASFFNITPNEADSMDPQQRLLLETVYEALEAGGHSLEGMRGTDTAVYVGTMTADYNGRKRSQDIPSTHPRLTKSRHTDAGSQHGPDILCYRDQSSHHIQQGLVLLRLARCKLDT